MSNVRINPTQPLLPTKSSTSGYSNSGSNKNNDKNNYGNQTFQDIFKLMLENQS